MSRTAILASFLLACACGWPAVGVAQVRQCIGSDGAPVYTDRKCEDIGGRERPVIAATAGTGMSRARGMCARSVQDLVYSLGSAIQSGDANQVAGLYDWTGMSTANGYRLMERLQAIAGRPLVDVQPMYAGGTNEYGFDVVEFDETTGEVIGKPARKPRLIGLRVEQTLGNGSTPSRTVFGLRQHLGCWWVRL